LIALGRTEKEFIDNQTVAEVNAIAAKGKTVASDSLNGFAGCFVNGRQVVWFKNRGG
jgi:hypothetical protein